MHVKKYLKRCAVLLFITVTGILFSCSKPGQEFVLIADSITEETESESVSESERTENEQAAELVAVQTYDTIYVHVAGSVINPGVYQLDSGQRFYDAVEAAGGFTQEAARDYLNLAEPLSDGIKVYVPSGEELENGGYDVVLQTKDTGQDAGTKDSALVNLNTADLERLMTLPGIGDAKARDIIAYREANGRFHSIEELKNVPGIKDGIFSKVEGLITID